MAKYFFLKILKIVRMIYMFEILEMTEEQFNDYERAEAEKQAIALKEQIDDMFGSDIKEGEDQINRVKKRLERLLRVHKVDAPFIILKEEVRMLKSSLEALK